MTLLSSEISKRARSGFIWLATTTFIWQGICWALTLITARILSPDEYGIAALPGTLVPILMMVASLEIGTWIVQEKSFGKKEIEFSFFATNALGLLVSLFAFLISPLAANFYKAPELTNLFRMISLLYFICNIGILPDALLRRELNFRAISIANLVTNVGGGAFTLCLALLGFSYWSLIISQIARALTKTLILIYFQGLPRKFTWDNSLFIKSFSYGAAATGSAILAVFYATFDEVVVGRMFSPKQLGYYSMAFFFSQLPVSKLQGLLVPLLIPYYSQLKNNELEHRRALLRTTRGIVSIVVPILLGFSLVAPEMTRLLLGKKWLPMVEPLRILSVVAILQSTIVSISAYLRALGRPQLVMRASLFNACLLPPMFIIGAKFFGLPGVYWAWACGIPFVALFALHCLRKVEKISYLEYFLNLRAPLFSGIAMAIFVYLLECYLPQGLNYIWKLTFLSIMGALTYSSCGWFLFRKDVEELIKDTI